MLKISSLSYLFYTREQRDKLFSTPDEMFTKICSFEPFKATGKGGQKRNKTSSAVRLTHLETTLSVIASEERSQHLNRAIAIRKMRLKWAFHIRVTPAYKIELPEMINENNPRYPMWVAVILDHLYEHNYRIKPVAEIFGFTTSKLTKRLTKDRTLWQFIANQKAAMFEAKKGEI